MNTRCVHCGKVGQSGRARALCGICYRDFSIRLLYPITSSSRKGSGIAGSYKNLEHGEPTTALPGSPEKIEILTKRAEKNQHLFHPKDYVEEFWQCQAM